MGPAAARSCSNTSSASPWRITSTAPRGQSPPAFVEGYSVRHVSGPTSITLPAESSRKLALAKASGSKVSCMRGAERKADTMGLSSNATASCSTNIARNLDFCVCGYEPCGNKGVCCNCIRNHFTTDGSGKVACMR